VKLVTRSAAAIAWIALAVAACNKSDNKSDSNASASEPPKTVREACQRRAVWNNRILKKCTQCLSLSAAPACGCKTDRKEYSGLCSEQQQARIDETACEPAYACTYKCDRNDCDCMARCYQSQERCEKLAAAVDSCVVEVCDPFCR
jgi:hypothetical protein